ncbi:ABC transporter ATP-binding protein [Bacillus pseudomycoides]|uniref:ABC transporter ATP-binding protein n=1 Tax=Bacillus pseudomycoides TaxID=64104 RepID=UPI000BEDC9F8|nr:ABC transporter ATP-binding protein [Bacillus pseudomycoides]MEB3056170.1 ABC transporter ATP-binding protein [Bacillus pseudomycoides]PEB40766.1 ABC transporter ATP-binding protein [Bacillus pseudomycoides]PEM36948.1 ABC transporter ATP-binding protein [Bacillus pseudomycoides]PGD94098.1 ABC transporter ATP-binding protein [Bacillus pseudomycoides]PGE05181.1 ABC transporter ATP-binding protein [Bacillus pseudomycoides]
MELFDYYRRKGKFKFFIGTCIFLFALWCVYGTWGMVNWGQVIFIVIVSSVFFGIGFWQLRKGNLIQKNAVKSNVTFWDIDTFVVLELPKQNKQFGLYHPDGGYVAGTKIISSNVLFSVIPFLSNRDVYGLEASSGEILAYFHTEADGYDWVIYDSNYNQIGMFKEKMIQGFAAIRGSLMTDKVTKLSDVEVEFDFIQSTLRTTDGRTLAIGKQGYMPIEWSERFMGLNVPTITLGSNASKNEKILGLGVLLYSLRTIEIRKNRANV